jgi:hypothetical protein
LVAPERGYFVDQRWMDLTPGLIVGLEVLRDPGYNVAYWNLPSREVTRGNGGYLVNGRPLRFFHFSGYDPDRPDQLSKHQDRIELERHPTVHELCDSYARALAAEGHERWRQITYAWGKLPDGTPLDGPARAVYRQGVADHALGDESVFSEAGADALLAYLRGPGIHGAEQGVTRYLEALRDSRADLREAFFSLDGADGARMVAWAEFSPELVPPSLLRDAGSRAQRPGVHAAGYFAGVMGTGEHGRQLVGALRTQRIPVTMVTLRPDAAPEDGDLVGSSTDGDAQDDALFNLLCVNADSVPAVASRLGDGFFVDRYTVGFWAWEVSTFPDRFLRALGYLDELWVGSRHVRDAIAPLATIPVLVIPQPVSLADGSRDASPPAGLPVGFRFLFAFDYLSVFERKNPLGVVTAFTRAFAPGSGAKLIIKALNPDHDPSAHSRLREAAAAHADIYLIEDRLSQAHRDGLMNAADCYVSLHRAEGFGYTLAESMWAGKPVIATGYSGNVDYMTPENSYLVDFRLVPIGPGHDPYPAHGLWAEPDLDHAAALMAHVFGHREEAVQRGVRAAADVRDGHSPEVAGHVMAQRLRQVLSSPTWRSAQRGFGRPGRLYTEWVGDLIRSGPVPPGTPRFGSAQRAARRGLLRLLKPLAVHERRIDTELLKAIQKLDANVRSLSLSNTKALRRIEALHGELLELRGELGPPERSPHPEGRVEESRGETPVQRNGRS